MWLLIRWNFVKQVGAVCGISRYQLQPPRTKITLYPVATRRVELRHMKPRTAILGVLVALLVVMAGCSGAPGDGAANNSTTGDGVDMGTETDAGMDSTEETTEEETMEETTEEETTEETTEEETGTDNGTAGTDNGTSTGNETTETTASA